MVNRRVTSTERTSDNSLNKSSHLVWLGKRSQERHFSSVLSKMRRASVHLSRARIKKLLEFARAIHYGVNSIIRTVGDAPDRS